MIDRSTPRFILQLIMLPILCLGTAVSWEANSEVHATGVTDVFINGKLALKDGEPTGAATGRVVRGRAWTGAKGGGCRASSSDWTWTDQPPRH